MKKTIYILLLTFLVCNLHAQGLYKNQEDKQTTSQTTEYSPSILRAKPEPPIGPGEDEAPVGEGLLLLAMLATLEGARRKAKGER